MELKKWFVVLVVAVAQPVAADFQFYLDDLEGFEADLGRPTTHLFWDPGGTPTSARVVIQPDHFASQGVNIAITPDVFGVELWVYDPGWGQPNNQADWLLEAESNDVNLVLLFDEPIHGFATQGYFPSGISYDIGDQWFRLWSEG